MSCVSRENITINRHWWAALWLKPHASRLRPLISSDGAVASNRYSPSIWAHYRDVIMNAHSFAQAQIKENIKAPCHWPCEGNSPVTGEFPAQKASNTENVFIWWRHHVPVDWQRPGHITTIHQYAYSYSRVYIYDISSESLPSNKAEQKTNLRMKKVNNVWTETCIQNRQNKVFYTGKELSK